MLVLRLGRSMEYLAVLTTLLLVALVEAARKSPSSSSSTSSSSSRDVNKIPENFFLGTATSSYQVEGAWNVDGKGESIWDHYTHEHPELIKDRSNGDVACNSYYLYKRDIEMLNELGAKVYRFSISWPRILPDGDTNNINWKGVDYYKKLIDELRANGIEPLVTIYHWDLPQKLQSIGGWTNSLTINYFVRYAQLLFETFGDKVKWWITFNEPQVFSLGYTLYGFMAPSTNTSNLGDYFVTHNVLKAHAMTYHLYDNRFRKKQRGKVGITMALNWIEPQTDSKTDVEAAERALQFSAGIWSHPIFSKKGDYPWTVKRVVGSLSKKEGRVESRLPTFSKQEVQYIKGTADFFGLNHYRTNYVTGTEGGTPFFFLPDSQAYVNSTIFGEVNPRGFRKLLNWLSKEYPGYPIFITENGIGDNGTLEDDNRVDYYMSYMANMLQAMHVDGIKVLGYTAWSLMDNYEWFSGYTEKFGLYQVDFSDPERPRTAKKSAKVMGQVFRSREIPQQYFT